MDALPEMPFDEQVRTGAPALPPPTAEELGTFYSSIDDGGLPPAIFMVLPEYSDRFVPPRSSEPPNLRQLLCHEAQSENLPQLVSRAQGTIPQLAITDEMVRHAEGLTRQQAKCPAWFKYRAGRVTASIMKSVCSTTTTQPSSQPCEEDLLSRTAPVLNGSHTVGHRPRRRCHCRIRSCNENMPHQLWSQQDGGFFEHEIPAPSSQP
ncbi:hypothetical protein HPB48_007541 [Haemaphysalis longicornis]|uniref:Uncharacterized protein n=1 Tax=Haemaphysalis longicornis TaxID=44386 RepID=A0A9J6FZI1_HAELO|nr:hypothetical protein HPB48_007541 [Haemaphysalis longicornis]